MKKFYLALLSLLAIGQSASAQFNWTGQKITQNSDLLITESDYTAGKFTDKNTLFLFNVGTGKLVDIGGLWGTSLELNIEKGIKFWLVYDETKKSYFLHAGYNTPDAFGGGPYVGYDPGTETNRYPFVDRAEEDEQKNINLGITQVNFTQPATPQETVPGEGGGYTYNLTLGSTSSREKLRFLTAVENDEINLTENADGANSEWKFITLEDYKKMFDKTYYSAACPADATFLIYAQSFGRRNNFLSKWTAQNLNGERKGVDSNQDGKYSHYEITSSFVNGRVYQEIEVPRSGWYSFTMQGFQYKGKQSDVNAYLFAHSGNNGEIPLLNGEQRRRNSTIALKDYTFATELQPTINDTDDPQHVAIGKALYKGAYPNQLYFYVPEEEIANGKATVTVGIYIPKGSNELIAIDNAQLKYLGDKDFVLDENYDGRGTGTYIETDYNAEGRTDNIVRQTMILARTIKKNVWNSLVLPVSLNRRQVRDCFGMNVKLAIMSKNLTNNGKTINFGAVDMFTGLTSEDIVLYANTPYLIRIDEETGRTTKNRITTSSGYEINANSSYYVVERQSCNLTTKRIPAYSLATGTDADNNPVAITFMGVYNAHTKANGNPITASCYALYDSNETNPNRFSLKYYPNGLQAKGFRAVLLEGNASKTGVYKQENKETTAKSNFITNIAIDGVSDSNETTEILSVLRNEELSSNTNTYDLSGRLVKDPSKKGIYIQNGRKIVIK